jgi:hypothetical protein
MKAPFHKLYRYSATSKTMGFIGNYRGEQGAVVFLPGKRLVKIPQLTPIHGNSHSQKMDSLEFVVVGSNS